MTATRVHCTSAAPQLQGKIGAGVSFSKMHGKVHDTVGQMGVGIFPGAGLVFGDVLFSSQHCYRELSNEKGWLKSYYGEK
jgi:hypothetical protein